MLGVRGQGQQEDHEWSRHMQQIIKTKGVIFTKKQRGIRQVIGKNGELLQTNFRIEYRRRRI